MAMKTRALKGALPMARLPRSKNKGTSGQMTIELAAAIPVMIAVAVISTNAMLFFSECAAFDGVACEAVRVHATSPGFGQSQGDALYRVSQAVASQFDKPYTTTSVSCERVGLGMVRYTARLEFAPTLFGMGFRSEVFGVALPRMSHSVEYVIDPYKPGVIA